MGSVSSKLVTALLVLIILATGLQLIIKGGEFLANEVFKIPTLEFWFISFLAVLGLGFLLGIDPSQILKGK